MDIIQGGEGPHACEGVVHLETGFSGVMDIVRGNWPDSDLSRKLCQVGIEGSRPGREEVFKFYIEILLAEYGSKVFCRGFGFVEPAGCATLGFAVAVAPRKSYYAFSVPGQYSCWRRACGEGTTYVPQ